MRGMRHGRDEEHERAEAWGGVRERKHGRDERDEVTPACGYDVSLCY